jgi:hypothetical protein
MPSVGPEYGFGQLPARAVNRVSGENTPLAIKVQHGGQETVFRKPRRQSLLRPVTPYAVPY